MLDSEIDHPETIPNHDTRSHVRFYDDFIGVLKGAVVALALLLIAMALFLVR